MSNEKLAFAYQEGKKAFKENICITKCPYSMMNGKMTPARSAWFKGYNNSKKNTE